MEREEWDKLSSDEQIRMLKEKVDNVDQERRRLMAQEAESLLYELFPLDGSDAPLTLETRDKALKLIGIVKAMEIPKLMDNKKYREHLDGLYMAALRVVIQVDDLIAGH